MNNGDHVSEENVQRPGAEQGQWSADHVQAYVPTEAQTDRTTKTQTDKATKQQTDKPTEGAPYLVDAPLEWIPANRAGENESVERALTPGALYRKTMPFVLLRLALDVLCAGISALILWFIYLTAKNDGRPLVIFLGLSVWAGATYAAKPVISHFGAYLIRAGHIAVITESVRTGRLPDAPIRYGLKTVKQRFPVTATYFFVHKLVSDSVRQVQRLALKATDDLSFLINAMSIDKALYAYMRISLGSVSDCCLGYTYRHKERGAFQASCDAVVIYAANWKEIAAYAAKTFIWSSFMGVVFIFVPIAGIVFSLFSFASLSYWILPIIVLGAYLATRVKDTVIDSYIVCRMVAKFSDCAEQARLGPEYYAWLKKNSGKFRRLCAEAKADNKKRREKRAKEPD